MNNFNGPWMTDSMRIEALERRVAALEKKYSQLVNDNIMLVSRITSTLMRHEVSTTARHPMQGGTLSDTLTTPPQAET